MRAVLVYHEQLQQSAHMKLPLWLVLKEREHHVPAISILLSPQQLGLFFLPYFAQQHACQAFCLQ